MTVLRHVTKYTQTRKPDHILEDSLTLEQVIYVFPTTGK